MDDEARLGAVELALSQAKRVQRESRLVVQSLARLRDSLDDDLQAVEDGHKENHEYDRN